MRPEAFGVVMEDGRGSLPYALIHGQPLVACAAWALEEAGLQPVDLGTPWDELVEEGKPVVLHDPLCPMTSASFLLTCVRHAAAHDCVVVGVRPVTDTVKVVDGEYVGDTADRAALLQVVSPIVLPSAVAAGLSGLLALDFAGLVARLAERFSIETIEAPADARRVGGEEELRVLEALTRQRHGSRRL